MSQVIKIKGTRAKSVHLGLKFGKFNRTHGAAHPYCGAGMVSTGTRMATQYSEMPADTDVTCKNCLKLDAEAKQAEADKTAAARKAFQEKLATERAAAEVVETVEVAPVATEASVEEIDHVVSLTPDMVQVLTVHRTASESLDEAYAAGMLVRRAMNLVALIPSSALPALLRFTGMRAELAQENFQPGASSYQRDEWRAEIALYELIKSL